MGQHKFPHLTRSEVTDILKGLGFRKVREEGSHAQWLCERTDKYPRSIVTVDTGYSDFDSSLVKTMMRQSNRTREEFFGADKVTAKKASVKYLKQSMPLESD